MNYIILDMEWDSAFYPKLSRFVNQILQIGAVKLNENFDIIDTFEINIKSKFSKRVSGRFSSLTGITTADMLSGVPFERAVERYNKWLGNDTVTMTWSDTDLYTIMENEQFLLDKEKFKIEKYLDLQKYIQNEMRILGFEINSQISLGNAASLLGITTDGLELHTAKDDSLVCALMLKKYYCKERFENYIKDTANPEFYKRLRFKPYYIDDLKNEEIDRNELIFICDECGGKTERISKWFYKNRWFMAKFKCKKCKRKFIGRVSFRKTFDEIIVKRRICEIKPKKETKNNEMQPVSEKV